MSKKISIYKRKVKYLRLEVNSETIRLIVPENMEIKPEEILERHKGWIEDKMEKLSKIKNISEDLEIVKQDDLYNLVFRFVNEIGEVLKIKPNKVLFRKMKKRWGSCNHSRKILIFNKKMEYLPEELIRYIVIHEMCHLIIRNHRKEFWLLIKTLDPDFKEKEKILAAYSLKLGDQ